MPFPDCLGFDTQDGDANDLSSHVQGPFAYIHASQCLEHLYGPERCLRDWATLLAPGGHIIATVPAMELYGDICWERRYNGDHKTTWSMFLRGGPAPEHVHVPTLCEKLTDVLQTKRASLIDTNYDYKVGFSRDQTYVEADMVEAFIEIVLQKV